jgi:choline dehydrogenase-like flavoprotein
MILKTIADVGVLRDSTRPLAVVVGSGAIGLFLARQLVRKGWRAVVLESGDATLGGFSSESWRSTGRPHLGMRQGRSRTIGGTSNLWGGQLVEFQPLDFERRPWQTDISWPVCYDDVAAYYPATYEQLGIGPTIQNDGPIWDAVLGATPRFTNDLEIFLTRWMKIPSVSVLFAEELRGNPHLTLLPQHTVVGFRGAGDAITGVVVRRAGHADVTVEGDCFIVAAGTVETVRLMLAATEDTEFACPWAGNGLLGRYFQDHLGGTIATVEPTKGDLLHEWFRTLYWHGNKFQPKVRLSSDTLRDHDLTGAQGIVAFDSSVSEHLVFLKQFLKAAIYSRRLTGVGSLFRHLVACARYLPPLMWTYLKDHRVFVPRDSRVSLLVQAEQRPLRSSCISVDHRHKDGFGLPQAVLHWEVDGNAVRPIRELAVRCADSFAAAGLGHVRISEPLLDSSPKFLDTLADTYHAAGGAVMGANSEAGVVDGNLRVFGTKNLYVASAATFPSSGSANVTFTAMAFATRLADHLDRYDA